MIEESVDQQAQTEIHTVADNGGPPEGLIDQLKLQRQEVQAAGKTKVIEVAGYQGLLGVEYRFIDSDETESIARAVRNETKSVNYAGSSLLSAMDTMIAACRTVVYRIDPKDPKDWHSLGGARDVRYDASLATRLDYVAKDPREAVLGLFGNTQAILAHNLTLSRWLADTTREIDEDFLG